MGNGSQIQGHSPAPGDTTIWRNIGATQLTDGSWALKVDTELTLDAGNISISNIKVGSTNQTSATLRFLKTLNDGTVVVTMGVDDPLAGFNAARSQDIGTFPHFFGLVDTAENWIIIKETKSGSESTFLYVTGTGSFATNWTARAGKTYIEYFDAF